MTRSRVGGYDVHEDARGSLLPVELAEVPFPVRRIFVVTGPAGGAERGDHLVPCGQEVVLISGSARFALTAAGGDLVEEFLLDRPGQRAVLQRGEYVRYQLEDDDSRIMVLAEEPYAGGAP